MFQPKTLHPIPEPFIVRELRRIDPELRVVWAYDRYLKSCWAIERRMTPERYFAAYASLLSDDKPRFIKQPIFDVTQPEFNEYGQQTGFKCVGYRDYDLAPEWEWLSFTDTLDSRVIQALRREYAWNRTHPYTREKVEEAERARLAAEQKGRRIDAAMEGVDEMRFDAGKVKHI